VVASPVTEERCTAVTRPPRIPVQGSVTTVNPGVTRTGVTYAELHVKSFITALASVTGAIAV
jgi:hypothetical protein